MRPFVNQIDQYVAKMRTGESQSVYRWSNIPQHIFDKLVAAEKGAPIKIDDSYMSMISKHSHESERLLPRGLHGCRTRQNTSNGSS